MDQGNRSISLQERVITAVLAPLFLHIVLLVLACLRPVRTHGLGQVLVPWLMASGQPLGTYLGVMWLAPALFGFLLGELSLRAGYEQLGYCSDRKNPVITLLLWLLLLFMLGSLIRDMIQKANKIK